MDSGLLDLALRIEIKVLELLNVFQPVVLYKVVPPIYLYLEGLDSYQQISALHAVMQNNGPLVLTQFQVGNEKGMRFLTLINLICLEVETIREHYLEAPSSPDQELDLDPWFMIICGVHNQFVQIKNLIDLIVYNVFVLLFLINVILKFSAPF